jgi:hypothetical protein
VRGVFVVDSDAKRRKNSVLGALASSCGRHKQFKTDLYSANEMSGFQVRRGSFLNLHFSS